jgi:hypothetical protein
MELRASQVKADGRAYRVDVLIVMKSSSCLLMLHQLYDLLYH